MTPEVGEISQQVWNQTTPFFTKNHVTIDFEDQIVQTISQNAFMRFINALVERVKGPNWWVHKKEYSFQDLTKNNLPSILALIPSVQKERVRKELKACFNRSQKELQQATKVAEMEGLSLKEAVLFKIDPAIKDYLLVHFKLSLSGLKDKLESYPSVHGEAIHLNNVVNGEVKEVDEAIFNEIVHFFMKLQNDETLPLVARKEAKAYLDVFLKDKSQLKEGLEADPVVSELLVNALYLLATEGDDKETQKLADNILKNLPEGPAKKQFEFVHVL